ncbi:S-layer homology domain-containing protein [Paenibacillaceae bacterium WGS1546]|uniref:S-layer homology domain-containing protein n=1 Tax=Cohnella sp. WGS1546 TaxID=3366810 RepID=UPI00372D858D
MNKGLSKGVAGLLAASLVFSGIAYTDSKASAASPFPDVRAGGWAEKHITKLALQGILKGSPNGQFNPANQITREEAVIIALRFMGVADQIQTGGTLVFPSDLVIKEDYKPYIKLAVQKNILQLDEEVALVAKENGKAWGSSPASREWIAKLLVRAIGKDDSARAVAGQATSFADDAQIDAQFKGYVNYAVSSELVTGVTGNRFDPQGAVTREMASTLFSRAGVHLPVAYAGQVTGALITAEGNQLTILRSDGTTQAYALSPSASVYGYKSDVTTDVASLKEYGEVLLIAGVDGTIDYVEQTSETPKVKNIEGTLILVSDAQNKLTVSVDGDLLTVAYDPQSLSIKDINGQVLKLEDLSANLPVRLGVDIATESVLLSLTVTKAVTNKSGDGTVEGWNANDRTLQVKDAAGQTETYPVDASATIKHANGTSYTFDQLTVGDVVSYEVKMGSVTSVTITKKVLPPIEAKIEYINTDRKTIQYTSKGELGVKYLANNVAVKLEGLTSVGLDDLFEGDDVSLTLDDDGRVAVITITGRALQFVNSATITTYLGAQNVLIVENPSKKNEPLPLVLNDKTRFDLNGTTITRAEAEKYMTVGKKLNVGYTNATAAYVSFVSQYSGTVVENNVTARTLKLALDTGNTVTLNFPIHYPSVDIYGQNYGSYLDIKIGDRVTAILDYVTQETVIAVQVQKTVQFELEQVNLSTNRLKAKKPDGTFEEWSLNGSIIALVDENDAPISLNALNQSNATLLNVTFRGKTAVKIKAVSATYGQVVSVNASANSIELVTNAGVNVTKAFTAAPTVLRNGVSLGSISTVQRDDRVEIRVDENDRVVVEIIPAVNKKYNNNNATTLYVQRSSLNENNTYPLHPQVYLHQGTKRLTFSDFKNNDDIALYIVRGKVVEIVKK